MAALLVYRDAVGLSLDADSAATPEQSQRRRDPAFRETVLFAYECAMHSRVPQAIVFLVKLFWGSIGHYFSPWHS